MKKTDKTSSNSNNPGDSECEALGQILDRIGSKWTVMIVGTLANGPMRFNALLRTLSGISHRMLTLTLRGLEQDGLVVRTAYLTIPPKVEYALTETGRSLIEPLSTLSQWAVKNRRSIDIARGEYKERYANIPSDI